MTCHLFDQPARASYSCPASTILIADADRSLADSLGRGLEQQGYYTLMARSGEAAIEMALSSIPQLIVMDQRLPDMDAVAAVERLAAQPETCHIPVIILRGMTRPDIIRRSRVAGCQYFVRKPCDPAALFLLIRHAIEETARAVMA